MGWTGLMHRVENPFLTVILALHSSCNARDTIIELQLLVPNKSQRSHMPKIIIKHMTVTATWLLLHTLAIIYSECIPTY